MEKFIKYEEWKDFWCFKPTPDINFKIFEGINTNSWKPIPNTIKTILESKRETNEPTEIQLNTLKFVFDKQIQILDSIYNFHQALIFPLYKEHIDIEDEQIITEISQTNIIYSIKSIQIPFLHETESVYFIINFNFAYDDEHDISFLFKDLSIIDFAGLGDGFIDYIELYENRLKKGNEGLTISISDHPAKSSIYRGKYSLNDKIKFTFENKHYIIGIRRDEWPQNFRIFFYPNKSIAGISLNNIIETAHNNNI